MKLSFVLLCLSLVGCASPAPTTMKGKLDHAMVRLQKDRARVAMLKSTAPLAGQKSAQKAAVMTEPEVAATIEPAQVGLTWTVDDYFLPGILTTPGPSIIFKFTNQFPVAEFRDNKGNKVGRYQQDRAVYGDYITMEPGLDPHDAGFITGRHDMPYYAPH